MRTFTIATAFVLAILLVCSGPSRVQAQGDTKIVIKDGGSLVIDAPGLDAGNWTSDSGHMNNDNLGALTGVQISDGGKDACNSDPKCGIDPSSSWTIQVNYDKGSLTITPGPKQRGLHIQSSNLPFDQWKKTVNDEREFHHGDGKRISSVTVNGGSSVCAGHRCAITLSVAASR